MSPYLGIGVALLILLSFAAVFKAFPLKQMNARKVVSLGLFVSLALVASIVESMLPDLLLPGAKLGLANLVILLLLIAYGPIEAIAVNLIRVLLASLLLGTFLSMGFWMSLAGALASFTVMAILSRFKGISLFFVSAMGALFHSLAQILVCFIYVGNVGTIAYLPFLLLISLGSGLFIALLAKGILRTKALSHFTPSR